MPDKLVCNPDAKGVADLDIAADDGFTAGDARLAAPEINVEAISERTRQPTYEELYGPRVKAEERVAPAPQIRVPRVPRAAVTVIAALGLVMSVIAGRATIVRLWPQAAKIYAATGLPVNERGLDLKNLHVNLVHDGAQALLVVDGEIANKRGDKTPVPKIKLAVRDAGGHEIYTWTRPRRRPSSTAERLSRSEPASSRLRPKGAIFSSVSPRPSRANPAPEHRAQKCERFCAQTMLYIFESRSSYRFPVIPLESGMI